MVVFCYWVIRILSWAGLLFCLFAVIRPETIARGIIKVASWKMSWFALKADIRTTPQTVARMRALSVVLAVIFTGLIYVFTEVITVAFVIE